MESVDTENPAALPNIIYRLLPELADLGSEVDIVGELELAQLEKGALLIRLPEGIRYKINLTNTGTGVLLNGTAVAEVVTDCTRCTSETRFSLKAVIEGYYIIDPRNDSIAEDDDSVIIAGEHGKIDLAEPIVASVIYELPFTLLCKEDCAGICDKCYANLNLEECTCEDDPEDPAHPFAALRTLFSGSEDDSLV